MLSVSNDLEDNVILETCKSPILSACISAVLRDLSRIQDTIKNEADRTKHNLISGHGNGTGNGNDIELIQVPDHYKTSEDEEGFWETKRWNNEAIKNRKICMATMKKVLQRDDRYLIHDVPYCHDCQSLHRNLQTVWDHGEANNGGVDD